MSEKSGATYEYADYYFRVDSGFDPDELFEKVEQHDGRVECEPYYNKWALYVAMNKAASDQNSVILKWIGDDKDKYIIACYDLALTDLKDKDRPYWIRKYFHVESKF